MTAPELGIGLAQSRECPPALPFVFAVGITGHRAESLEPSSLGALRARIGGVLGQLRAAAESVRSENAAFFAGAPARFLFVSPLADGADQIGAELALDLGFELHAVLPFSRERTRADLPDEDSRERFDRLIERAVCVLDLPGDEAHELEAYVMAGRATVAHCDLMVAVWDGLPARGRGGTAEVVRFAFDRATPVVHVPVAAAEPVRIRWAAFEPAIVTRHEDAATVRELGSDVLEAVVTALLAPPPDPQERHFIRLFQGECRRRIRTRIEYPLLLAAAGVSRFGKHHWRGDLCQAQTSAEWQRYCDACARADALSTPLDSLQHWYEWADGMAGHFAQSYRSGHVFNFILSALAVIVALTALIAPGAKPFLAVAEFAAVCAILVNTWLGNRQQWHRRWLDYRQLAERLRPMRSLKVAGVAAPGAPGTPANPVARRWIDWYAAAVWRATGCPTGRIDAGRLKALTGTIAEHELRPQIDYHRSSAEQAKRLDHRLEMIGYAVFAATLIAIAVLLVALGLDKHWAADRLGWFTLVTAGLPAIGTALFGIRVQGDYVGSAVRSEQTARLLEQIADRLEKETESLTRAADLVEESARTMLADLDEWRLLNEQHDLSVG